MARHPDCTWIPSPNFGYGRNTHGQLTFNINRAGKSGEFWHSQQGRQSVAIAMFQNPATELSAHFLFPKTGRPVQMVDSADPAWHAGNYLANLHFHGFEFEGGPPGNLSEPLTANQVAWGVKVTHWLRKVHGTASVYVRRDTLWEHNEVRNTACPSGRILWPKVIAALKMEEDMPLNAADKTWLRTMSAQESKKAAEVAVKPVAADVAALRKSHVGGELPGLWWKVKGVATIWYVDYVDGVLMRHSARNPQSYLGMGGDWKVIEVTAKQRDKAVLGAPMPDLKV